MLAALAFSLALAPPAGGASVAAAQPAPAGPGGVVMPTPVLVERELFGVFVLRREELLRWAPVARPVYGFTILPRPAYRLTLGFRPPALQPISLAVETVSGVASTPGLWSARLAVKIPETETAVYVARSGVAHLVSSGARLIRGAPLRGAGLWSMGFAGRF